MRGGGVIKDNGRVTDVTPVCVCAETGAGENCLQVHQHSGLEVSRIAGWLK